MFKKGYFVFSIMSNTDFEKLLKIISQRALLKLQAETVFHNTSQRPEEVVQGCSVKAKRLKNFINIREKDLYRTLYFNTAASTRPTTC